MDFDQDTDSDREAGRTRLDRNYAVAIAGGFALAAAVGLVIVSHRFGIGLPGIVDDWSYASEPGKSLSELVRPFFHPVIGRFHPTYEVVSHAQWHLLGAPGEMLAPNLYASVRLLLFCAAVTVVPGVVAATSRPRPAPVLLAALCTAAALLVFSSPAADLSFLRLGHQEALFVGSVVCGAAITIWATGQLLAGRAGQPLTVVALLIGLGLWSLGVYFKEPSVVLPVMAPFLYLHLDRRWREQGVLGEPLWRQRSFQLVSLAMLVPLLHVAIGSATVPGSGFGFYGAEEPSSIGDWLERLVDATKIAWDLFATLEVPEWRLYALAILALTATLAWQGRRAPWLALGLLVDGTALLIFQLIALVPNGRYAIPAIALFAMAGLLMIAQSPPWVGWVAVIASVVLAVSNFAGVRNAVDGYASWEEADNGGTIDFVASLNPASCPVYMMNLVAERSEALPKILGLREEPLTGTCRPEFAGVMVGYETYPGGPLGVDDSVRRACSDPAGPAVLKETPAYAGPPGFESAPPLQVLGCRRFARRLDGRPVKDALRVSRLVPGEGNFETRERCAARYGLSTRCYTPASLQP